MQDYAEKEGLLCQPRKMLISSYFLENGTLITPLLLFYLELGLVCKKIYRFIEYTPVKCFNKFLQSAVDARRKGDENRNSRVVAETMKLLANSSYGYQIMDRSLHTVKKHMSDEKTHGAINTKFFKRLDYINDQLYEVELATADIDHRKPVFVGFFLLQYAKLRMLELYYNFFDKFCDVRCFDTESNRFKPQQNKSRNFENMVMSYFQRKRPDCKIESFYTTGTQQKKTVSK